MNASKIIDRLARRLRLQLRRGRNEHGFTSSRRSAQQGFTSSRRSAQQGFTSSRRSAQQGFTLVELMVVIVILGLLATVVVINVMPAQDTARIKKAEADIAMLEQAAEMYRLTSLNYPTSAQGLQALVASGVIKRLPNDPWGNPYVYAAPGANGRPFDIYSLGADGKKGGEGNDADIGTQ
jgi:general secretion pathway protein G